MKEKHPIDSFFKDKLAERQYPMKEEYWAPASALIEANSVRKRRKFLWFFLFLGLLSGSSLIGYFTYNNEGNSSPEMVQDLLLSSTESKPAYVEIEGESEHGKKIAAQNKAGNTPDSSIINQKSEAIAEKKARNETQARVIIKGQWKENSVVKILEQAKKQTISASDEKPKSTAIKGSRVLATLDKESIKELPVENLKIPETDLIVKPQNLLVAAQFMSKKKIYLTGLPLSTEQLYELPFLGANRRHSLGLDFGFALHNAIGSKTEQQQSLGMSPIAGIGYRFQVNRNLSILSGLRYTQTPSLAGDSTYTSTAFSFGATIQGIRIRPLTLHQLELPLSLRWQVGARTSLAFGGYLRYLLNVRSEVSSFENNPFESASGPVNKAWGYKQGFKAMDLGLQLGYYYQLSEGLHFGLEAQYGLMDIRGDAFYRTQYFDRNLNARLVLRYDFARF